MSVVRGETTIQYVRQGDTLNCSLRSTFPLKQFVTAVSGNVTPSFQTNTPCIYPVIRSSLKAQRVSAITTDVHWYYNGAEITFGSNGLSTGPTGVTAGTFKSELKTVDGFQVPTLTILKDLASLQNIDSDTIEFKSSVNTGFVSAVAASIEVSIEQTEGEAYVPYITIANGGTIDSEHSSLQAKAHLLVGGTEKLSTDGVTFCWYKMHVAAGTDGWQLITGATSSTYTINAADVNSEELYKCAITYGGRTADAVVEIVDETDPLVMYLNPVDANNNSVPEIVSVTQQVLYYKPKVVKRSDETVLTGYVFDFLLTDAAGNEIDSDDGKTQFTVTLDQAVQAQGNLTLHVNGRLANG